MYGNEKEDIDRQALHAFSLSFPSPISGEKQTVIAPLPKDIEAVLKKNGIFLT